MRLNLFSGMLLMIIATLIGCGSDSSKSLPTASAMAAAGVGASSGAFSNGPDMATPRGQHTATVLPDGRVLVVGGTDGGGVIADAEIFDPLTNTWGLVRHLHRNPSDGLMMDPTGSFPTARQLHSATLLADGRVLIAGGVGIEQVDIRGTPILETLRTAYTFDPRTHRFSRVGSLSTARAWHEAAPIPGGGAVLVGGLDTDLRSIVTADVFDPASNSFVPIAMGGAHTWGSLVETSEGALIVAGADVRQSAEGWTVSGLPPTRVERFSLAIGGFMAANPNMGDRVHMGAALAPGGAFFAGGQAVQGAGLVAVNTTERYDAATGTFRAGPTLNTARFGAEVAPIGASGDLLVIGGVGVQGQQVNSCEIYSTSQNTMIGTVNMLVPRSDFRAVTLRDGRILVIGGLDAQSPPRAMPQTEFFSR